MNFPLQTTFRGLPKSLEMEAHIREKAEKLGLFYERIKSCHVIVEVPHKHHHQGKEFNVRIDIGVPGNEIVVNHDHSEDPYVALRDAFDAAKRQVEDHARKIRGDVKKHDIKRGLPIEQHGIGEQVLDEPEA